MKLAGEDIVSLIFVARHRIKKKYVVSTFNVRAKAIHEAFVSHLRIPKSLFVAYFGNIFL